MSRKLFESDPFLVRQESLDAYGEELEDNIMVRRTVFSAKQDFLRIIGSPNAQPNFEPPKVPPDKALVRRYLESRRKRKALKTADRKALQAYTMTARGEKTARRVRPEKDKKGKVVAKKIKSHDKAQAELKELFNNRLRIATIGYRVSVGTVPDRNYLNEDLRPMRMPKRSRKIKPIPDGAEISQLGRTVLTRNAHKKKWMDTVCGHIKTAIRRGSQIVVLPEFALPPAMDQVDLEKRIHDSCVAACAGSTHEHFIFAGSRHEGLANRGLTLRIPRQLPAEKKWHHKIFSAHALGENILGPRRNRYPKYDAKIDLNGEETHFVVTVAICYDSFDPTNFLRLVIESIFRTKKELDDEIILVPSFNTSPVFVEYLRDLSFLTGSTVVYVNGLHGDARVFIAGFSVADLLDEGRDRAFANVRQHIKKLKIDYDEFIKQRKAAIAKNQPAEADKLFQKATKARIRRLELEGHLATIKGVKDNRGFDHLITVEHCRDCHKPGGHRDDYGCKSDILYYNIDTRLLEAIRYFRENYILSDDSFLPRPLRDKSMLTFFDYLGISGSDRDEAA